MALLRSRGYLRRIVVDPNTINAEKPLDNAPGHIIIKSKKLIVPAGLQTVTLALRLEHKVF